jgi:hypothetical protein
VDAWATDMEANMHGVIPFGAVLSIIRVDVHSVVRVRYTRQKYFYSRDAWQIQ